VREALDFNDPRRTTMIESKPEILGGKPVVEGTRISVEMILESLAAAESMCHLIDQHPRLTQQYVRDAIKLASPGDGCGLGSFS
jgi:uncharacterized protein (DUF433 family)